MADIAKISVSGIQYDIKDETARNKVTAIEDGTKTLTSVTTSGNASVGGTLNVSGTTTLSGNLTVTGDITQSGSSYETHAEQVYTKKDMIITRDGATGGLGNNQYTGIQAKKYDGTNDGQLVFDKDGIARVGDVGQLQALATREDTPSDNYMPYWDAATNKFVTTLPTFNILCGSNADADCVGTIGSLTGYVNGMTVKVLFTNGHYGSTFTLNLDSQGAKPIWVNKDGTPAAMTSNSLDRGDGTARNWFVQPYTTLELMYVSSLNSGNGAWLVIGNPVVLSSTTSGYTIYADGSNTQQIQALVKNTEASIGRSLRFFGTLDGSEQFANNIGRSILGYGGWCYIANPRIGRQFPSENNSIDNLYIAINAMLDIFCDYKTSKVYVRCKYDGGSDWHALW